MSGIWLISYIALWGLVLFQGVVIFVLLRQLGIMYLGTAQGVAGDGLAVGSKAPGFSAEGLDGQPVSLNVAQGLQLLLVFGSSNCAPCRTLIPDLNKFADERRETLRVLFLCRGSTDEARRFASELELRVPIASHPDESLPEMYKARVTPFAFLIDGDLVIKAKGLANNHEHLNMLLRSAREQEDPGNGAHRNGAKAAELPVMEEEGR